MSGKCPAAQRPAFQDLLSKIRRGETLVVSKMDRLGRDAIDVLQTVRLLQERGVHVIVHQLGHTDLASPAGKLLLTMLSALAEMERDLLVERTQAGLARAKAEGKQLGRKAKTDDAQRQDIRRRLEAGSRFPPWRGATPFPAPMSSASATGPGEQGAGLRCLAGGDGVLNYPRNAGG